MSENYRGDPKEQTAMSKFYRGRWQYGSLYVLDIDRLICDPDGQFGILIEEKFITAEDKSWRITREVAARLGWWSAQFIYDTDTGDHYGNVTRIDATLCEPDGCTFHDKPNTDIDKFTKWVHLTFARHNLSEGDV